MNDNAQADENEFELDLVDEKIVIVRGNGTGSVRVVLYGPFARKMYTRKTYADGRVVLTPIEIKKSEPLDKSHIDTLISVGITPKEAKKSRRK